jgi:hypothetical protein
MRGRLIEVGDWEGLNQGGYLSARLGVSGARQKRKSSSLFFAKP